MCCGRDRIQQRIQRPTANPYAGVQQAPKAVSFVYLGNTALSVRGPVTGRDYRFTRPGARLEVDPRDRILLASLRQLKQVI